MLVVPIKTGWPLLLHSITLLIIAHRLETISIADKVYFVDSGKISEILDPLETIQKESKMKELNQQIGEKDTSINPIPISEENKSLTKTQKKKLKR